MPPTYPHIGLIIDKRKSTMTLHQNLDFRIIDNGLVPIDFKDRNSESEINKISLKHLNNITKVYRLKLSILISSSLLFCIFPYKPIKF